MSHRQGIHVNSKLLIQDIASEGAVTVVVFFCDFILGCVRIKDHATQVYIVDFLDQLHAHWNAPLLQPSPSDT